MANEERARSTDLHERGRLYTAVFDQINRAMEQGFYLEAVALYESLVRDRLESRISYLKGESWAFKTLGKNLEEIRCLEKDGEIDALVKKGGEIDAWRDKRNRAVHELAKLAEGDSETFSQKYAALEGVAKEGGAIFRRLGGRITALRRESARAENAQSR